MKALVTYYSQTGNTKKVAQAIFEAITMEKEIKSLKEMSDFSGYDIIFFGFPVHAHSVPEKAATLIGKLPAGQKIAFFSTHGSMRDGQLPKQALEHAFGLAVGQKILGSFGCRGQVSQPIIDALMKSPEHKAWAEEAAGANGHPDDSDLADTRKFVSEILAKVI